MEKERREKEIFEREKKEKAEKESKEGKKGEKKERLKIEKKELIKKIKSNYNLNGIFDYIKDKNFKLKLCIHSKAIQNRLNLKIIYKEIWLEKIGFNLDELLHYGKHSYEGDINKIYKKFLSENKLDKREFEKILYEVLKNKVEDINKNEVDETNREKDFNLIDIDSPLFEIILKSNNLEKYTIYISFEDNETDEKEKEKNEKKIIEKERKKKTRL